MSDSVILPVSSLVRFEGQARLSDEHVAQARDPAALREYVLDELFRDLGKELRKRFAGNVVTRKETGGEIFSLHLVVLSPEFMAQAKGLVPKPNSALENPNSALENPNSALEQGRGAA